MPAESVSGDHSELRKIYAGYLSRRESHAIASGSTTVIRCSRKKASASALITARADTQSRQQTNRIRLPDREVEKESRVHLLENAMKQGLWE